MFNPIRLLLIAAMAGQVVGGVVGGIPQAPGQPRDVAPKPVVGKGSISGRVVTGDTGMPVRRATVNISGSSMMPAMPPAATGRGGAVITSGRGMVLPSGRRAVFTDHEGRYSATGLPPGSYSISATPGTNRAQYLSAQYGTTDMNARAQLLELADGQQLTDINFALPRAGAISGQVTDEAGEPVSRAQVSLFMMRRGSEPSQMSSAQSDDRGHYRVFGLQPGEYVVSADVRSMGGGMPMEVQGEAMGFARSYAPGTPSLAQAQRLKIQRGTEATADIRLSETRLFSVTGTVVDSAGQVVRNSSISFSQADGPMAGNVSFGYSVQPNGQFVARGVAPGRYDITARVMPARPGGPQMSGGVSFSSVPGGNEGQEMGFLTIDVAADLDGVVVVTQPPTTVTGEIVFEEPAEGRKAQINATSLERRGGGMMVSPSTEVTETTFTLKGLFAPVLVRGTVNGPGWGLKAVLLGGKDITDQPTLFTSKDSGHLKVVFTSRAALVEGVVTDDAGKPTRDALVMLFGQDEGTWIMRSSMTRSGTPDKDGKFVMRGLREGDYFAIALPADNMMSPSTADKSFLAELSKLATRVTVNPGETRTVDLKISRIE